MCCSNNLYADHLSKFLCTLLIGILIVYKIIFPFKYSEQEREKSYGDFKMKFTNGM